MKDQFFKIQGLGGKKTLSGEIEISGSKNACLPMLAASLAFDGSVILKNIPDIEDIKRTIEIFELLGVSIRKEEDDLVVESTEDIQTDIDEELAKKMRASVLFVSPILAKYGKCSFPHPGGCVIGKRPIDLFLDNFSKMGVSVQENNEKYILEAKNGLMGADIIMPFVSVGATESFLIAGSLAKGTTRIVNASMEPEVVALGEMLIQGGAKIEGLGTSEITIQGVKKLKAASIFEVIPDRLEAGSFLMLGALAAKDLVIKNCNPKHLSVPIELLRESGVPIEVRENEIRIVDNAKDNKEFGSFNIQTHEYPGFPTDLQAPVLVFLTQTTGESRVFETIFEGRLNYTESLRHMGADVELLDQHRAIVKGPKDLKGKTLKSPDIRAGLAFVIAGIIAKGETEIGDIYYIDRGYERIEEKLQAIGVDIERVGIHR